MTALLLAVLSLAETYVNSKYNYSLTYPEAQFRAMGEAGNGDGQRFVSKDGKFTIAVWASYNALDRPLAAEFANAIRFDTENRRLQVTYKTSKPGAWFVYSGVAAGGESIIYRRTVLESGTYKTIDLEYPAARRAELDPLVKQILNSFKTWPEEK